MVCGFLIGIYGVCFFGLGLEEGSVEGTYIKARFLVAMGWGRIHL